MIPAVSSGANQNQDNIDLAITNIANILTVVFVILIRPMISHHALELRLAIGITAGALTWVATNKIVREIANRWIHPSTPSIV